MTKSSSIIQSLRTFLGMPISLKWLHIEAMVSLLVALVMVRVVPFRWIVKFVSTDSSMEEVNSLSEKEAMDTKTIVSAVRIAASRMPFELVCLPRSCALKWMLNRRGLASTLCVGTNIKEGEFKAHAWLEVGDKVVMGGENSRREYEEMLRID